MQSPPRAPVPDAGGGRSSRALSPPALTSVPASPPHPASRIPPAAMAASPAYGEEKGGSSSLGEPEYGHDPASGGIFSSDYKRWGQCGHRGQGRACRCGRHCRPSPPFSAGTGTRAGAGAALGVGTGTGTGMWMRMVMGKWIGIRMRMGTGDAVTSPPPSLQVAKAGEGFVGTPRDFGDGVVEGDVRGPPLNLPPSGWGIPGTVLPPRDLLAPVALLS